MRPTQWQWLLFVTRQWLWCHNQIWVCCCLSSVGCFSHFLWGFCVVSLFCRVVFDVFSSLAFILLRERERERERERAGHITLIVLWLSVFCVSSSNFGPWAVIVAFPGHTHLPFNNMCYLGPDARKPVFGVMRTTTAQTSLRIRADWSAPLYSLFGKYHLLTCYERNFSFLACLCIWAGWFESLFVGNFLASRSILLWRGSGIYCWLNCLWLWEFQIVSFQNCLFKVY